jgi:predicted outer membrane protein
MTTRGDEYRRRAKICFDAAYATENEKTRAALLGLAEEWLRMAESWDAPLRSAAEQARPIFQQQQQVQSEDDDGV